MDTRVEIVYTADEKRELIKKWANDDKRRAFPKEYRDWGVWITLRELDLTFYKYDLPDGKRIVVMEYVNETMAVYGTDGKRVKFYLQEGEFFLTHSVNDYAINDHLKNLKIRFQKELKESA
jgi:hypothetical protein